MLVITHIFTRFKMFNMLIEVKFHINQSPNESLYVIDIQFLENNVNVIVSLTNNVK